MKVRKSVCVFEFGMVYTRTYDSTGDFFVEFEHPRAKARTGDEHNLTEILTFENSRKKVV